MSDLTFTETATVSYNSYYSPDGDCCFGFVTEQVDLHVPTFGQAIAVLIRKKNPDRDSWDYPRNVLMTTRSCCSGYSEYTITNEWSEVTLTAVDWNWEQTWETVGLFLRDLAAANPESIR